MDRDTVITKLRASESEFRQLGVESLSLFGSLATFRSTESSDVDIAVKLNHSAIPKGFRYAGRLQAIQDRLEDLLDAPVDVVDEPVGKSSLQDAINRDRVLVF
jgi:predicted nucleotidyltransferase